jgi:uncharacterized protein YdeI (BOF family)
MFSLKRALALVFAMVMTFALFGCGANNDTEQPSDESTATENTIQNFNNNLVQKAIAVTDSMIKKAKDDNYIIFSGATSELFSHIKPYSQLEEVQPVRAVVIKFSDFALDRFIDLDGEQFDSENPLLTDTKAIIRKSILSNLAYRINAAYGLSVAAAMQVLAQSEAFQEPANTDFNGCRLVILVYNINAEDNEWTPLSFVAFRQSEENTVIASAAFVFNGSDVFTDVFFDDEKDIPERLSVVLEEADIPIYFGEGVSCTAIEKDEMVSIEGSH